MSIGRGRRKTAKRMSAADRKSAILRAAAPVIAQSGLHGASVREIALAAGVSEALLYKHFPSKQALYDEALAAAREFSQFTIARFATLEPGTESFVLLTYATIDFSLYGFPGQSSDQRGTIRLMVQSLLDDGTHARAVFADTAASWMEYVLASYEAAIASGDVELVASEPSRRFRFVQQLGMALRLSHLPEPPAFEYSGNQRELADEAVAFSLRGVGLSDVAIRKYCQPKKLRGALDALFCEPEE